MVFDVETSFSIVKRSDLKFRSKLHQSSDLGSTSTKVASLGVFEVDSESKAAPKIK